MSVQMSVQMSVENSSGLSATGKKVLAAIAASPSITLAELAESLGVARRTVERNVKVLQEKGLLTRVGPTKNGVWRVV